MYHFNDALEEAERAAVQGDRFPDPVIVHDVDRVIGVAPLQL